MGGEEMAKPLNFEKIPLQEVPKKDVLLVIRKEEPPSALLKKNLAKKRATRQH